jgi:hypothetical protein
MRQYRFTRRAFMTGVGGAFGLKILLRNLESRAAGAGSPARFLMTHWPVGTMRYHFKPTGTGTNYTTSRILQPFETAGLRDDMIVLYGLSHGGINTGQGGGHEAGTPMTTTGANCPGTRANGGEEDDASAGGPSWDQILLKNVPGLQRPGAGYANAICDARVDSLETSTQCLSYSHDTRSIQSARPGGQITEAVPLLPTLSPFQLYANLFSGFMPGDPGQNQDAVIRALQNRQSVLDNSRRELDELRLLAPSSEWGAIDGHLEIIRSLELQLADQIANGGGLGEGCVLPMEPAESLRGETGSRFDYTNPETDESDEELHEQIGKTHMAILRAAFQCDIIRVATFQWSPGTNHVSFKGLDPNDENRIFMHHPLSHKEGNPAFYNGSPPGTGVANAYIYEAMVRANIWYFQKYADILSEWKTATDAYGNSLLDYTVIPMVTEVAEAGHTRSPMPGLIFGGKALGMIGGQFQDFSQNRSHNDLWLTCAQAFLGEDPLSQLQDEVFVKNNVRPIDGCWAPPA